MMDHGTFLWNELVTSDQKKCGDFYCELLGWNRQEVDSGPFGIYTIFHKRGENVAGMMNPTSEYTQSRPSGWYAYIAVEDVDACALRVKELDGDIIEPPIDVPGVGRVCMLADPAGAVVMLITPIEKP